MTIRSDWEAAVREAKRREQEAMDRLLKMAKERPEELRRLIAEAVDSGRLTVVPKQGGT